MTSLGRCKNALDVPEPERVPLGVVESQQREAARELPDREQREHERGLAARRGARPRASADRRAARATPATREQQRQPRGLVPTEHHGVAETPGRRGALRRRQFRGRRQPPSSTRRPCRISASAGATESWFATRVIDDFDRCYRVLQSRDSRFDGWFVTAVKTTGIYCRPSCPAMLPKPGNVRFYPTAAAAQEAGFRACKRCRPDASPGSPEWDMRADLVAAGNALHRRRGRRPRRCHRAREPARLRRTTDPALSSSPRSAPDRSRSPARNEHRPRACSSRPRRSTSRRSRGPQVSRACASSTRPCARSSRRPPPSYAHGARERDRGARPAVGSIDLRLPLREPFNIEGVFAHLVATAVPGVEEYLPETGTYRRSLRLPHGHGIVELGPRRRPRALSPHARRPARPHRRGQPLPPAARSRRRPGRRRCTPLARRGARAARREGARPPGPPHRRSLGARAAGGARSTGVDAQRARRTRPGSSRVR